MTDGNTVAFFFSWENNIKVLSFALHIQCTNYETPILKANIGLQSCYPKQTEPKLCHDALLWLLSSRRVLNRHCSLVNVPCANLKLKASSSTARSSFQEVKYFLNLWFLKIHMQKMSKLWLKTIAGRYCPGYSHLPYQLMSNLMPISQEKISTKF